MRNSHYRQPSESTKVALYVRVPIILLVAWVLLSIVGLVLAEGMPWHQAEAAVQLGKFPESPGDVPRPAHSLAINAQQLPAMLWPAPVMDEGQVLMLGTEDSAGNWSMQPLLTSTQNVWAPELVYVDGNLVAAWLEGIQESWKGDLIQMDVASGLTITVKNDVRGFTMPEIAVSPTGLHMVFTSPALEEETIDKAHLYYAHRPAGDEELSWTYRVLVGRDQVITGADSIWWPRIALSADGTEVHLVWRQEVAEGDELDQVWYMPGNWDMEQEEISWGNYMRITAGGHQRMVEPSVAVDPSDDSLYITWVHWTIGPPEEQDVYLCRWNGEDCEVLTRLNEHNIEVSRGAPVWAHPSVAARDGMVCVSWHARDQVYQLEEIIARCSSDRGETWQHPINISAADEHYAVYADIYLDGFKQLHVAWLELYLDEIRPAPDHIYYRRGTSTVNIVYLPLITRGYR